MSKAEFIIPNEKTRKLVAANEELNELRAQMHARYNTAHSIVRSIRRDHQRVAALNTLLSPHGGYTGLDELLKSCIQNPEEIQHEISSYLDERRAYHADARRWLRGARTSHTKVAKIRKSLEKEPIRKYTCNDVLAAFPDHIESCNISDGKLNIYTKPLWAKVNKYDASKYRLRDGMIPLKPIHLEISQSDCGSIKFYPHGHEGYHSGHCRRSPHPHIMSEHQACWGDFSGPLSEAWATTDLRMYLDVVFLFLAQVNADGDPAGASWPKMFWTERQRENRRNKFGFNYDTREPTVDQELVDVPAAYITEFRGHTLRFWSPGNKIGHGDVVRRASGQLYRRTDDNPNEFQHLLEWLLAPTDETKAAIPRFELREDVLTEFTNERVDFWISRLPNLPETVPVPAPVAETAPAPAPAAKPKRTRKPKAAPAPATPASAVVVSAPTPAPAGVDIDFAALDALIAGAEPGAEIVA